ncbi:hypothetical protein GSI_04967 [Ganoderma sinense ZZ0214-1]|uniref:Uncharacterized protein n=1 Tax=Ganoderma sinense ZZ0214-1 TaxID=1077348 RepID=A0A2G8SGE7_9APHY|nr:hypothetical protein GSI_04967 [Ganoderma sinense ZZ0214-1]
MAYTEANTWAQIVTQILNQIAFSTFSALRAYALSNRSVWLAAVIIFLALPPVTMRILLKLTISGTLYQWCAGYLLTLIFVRFSLLSRTVFIVTRGSQLLAELLVVGITWWYTYQSYRIRQGVELGKTVSSLLLYNGSMYFLFLAIMFILDIVFGTPGMVPVKVRYVGTYLDTFIDPATSLLTCHFMLSLRQFDSTVASTTDSRLGPQLREHVASTVLQFGAQPSNNLPSAIASFAHPVHVDDSLFETDSDAIVGSEDGSEWPETPGAAAQTPDTPSSWHSTSPAQKQGLGSEASV